MKEFVIARIRNIGTVAISRQTRAALGQVFGQEQAQVMHYENLEGDLYFADTYEDGLECARLMTQNNPQYTVVVAKTSDVFHRPPAEVQHSKFTDKGLLPA